jgi:hypothetical protein
MEERREAKRYNRTFKNPFDKGWRKNLRRVFGELTWYQLLIPIIRDPPSDPDYPFDLGEYLANKVSHNFV